MDACIEKACRVFGVTKLFPEQEKALKDFIDKNDVSLNLPTGFGKSLVFQMAPLVHAALRWFCCKSHRRNDFPIS